MEKRMVRRNSNEWKYVTGKISAVEIIGGESLINSAAQLAEAVKLFSWFQLWHDVTGYYVQGAGASWSVKISPDVS